jgi:hypothetical protein
MIMPPPIPLIAPMVEARQAMNKNPKIRNPVLPVTVETYFSYPHAVIEGIQGVQ